MARETVHVSKVRITVERGGDRLSMLSKKRARKSQKKHGKLEMLGGHLKPEESPLQALIRELREEEASGLLSAKVRSVSPEPREVDAGGARHYLFDIEISYEEFTRLQPSPKESLGFRLVPTAELEAGKHHARLTPKTRKILNALAEVETEE